MAAAAPREVSQYKLVLLGESGVGKSNLVLQYVKGQFSEGKESTIGAAFISHNMELSDRTIKLEIWDTAGQERYHSLAPMYYRGAQAAIIVYDITEPNSFERAKSWIKELHRQASPGILIFLVGNKVDLEQYRQVPIRDAEVYAEEEKIWFMETSAKTAHNVAKLFASVGEKLPRKAAPVRHADVIDPQPSPAQSPGQCSC